MDAYCEDCKRVVLINIVTDWMGDPDGMYGVWPIIIWKCSECGGEEIIETDGKQSAVPEDEDGALPEGQTPSASVTTPPRH